MKKFLSICSLIGAVSLSAISLGALSANAQPASPAEGDRAFAKHWAPHEHKFDPAERAAYLQKALQLSDEQTAKVKKLFEDSAQQRKTITDKYKPQFDAFHADMKKLHEQTTAQLNGVLTPKQQQALEAQRKSHDGARHHRRDGDTDNHDHRQPS